MKNMKMTESKMCVICAENLQYLRKSHNGKISQQALARILNLSPKTIMNYESAKSSLSAYAVYRLADYYGCTMEELLTKNLLKERTDEV
ncbi:MAG: helix-turn-helix transcriptional regulator [Eubacteriales bacterium]|nr:helix-turn-helix transcriptional regulator [Eubacteriales bacterium]